MFLNYVKNEITTDKLLLGDGSATERSGVFSLASFSILDRLFFLFRMRCKKEVFSGEGEMRK